MALSVKNKIWLGTLFLFLLLLLTGGVGIYYTAKFKDQTRAVLKDNYESLSYAHAMQEQLDVLMTERAKSLANFDSALRLQEQNVTEAGERQPTADLRQRFDLNRHDEFGRMAEAFNEMAERLQNFESSNLAKLLFEKSRAEAVINSLKDASIGLDKDGRILFANEQARQLLHLNKADIVGKPAEEVSARNDLFRFLLQNESNAPFKIVVDNRENYFTKETVEVSQGDSESRVIVIRNITSFKELDVAKTNFIATVSHELKTPLAASDFSLKLLGDVRTGSLNEEQQALLQNMLEDNQRMLKILSELLNMSQVEAGRIQLTRQQVSPQVIVGSAVQTVASVARENEVRILTEAAQNLPQISVDAEKTTWALNNLLTNAIKYSGRGSTVAVRVQQANGSLQFAVQDSGAGIAKEHQDRLFDHFYQAPGARLKGSGLGLAISKDFIEAQGGRIWVKSEVGQGATFYFTLPVV